MTLEAAPKPAAASEPSPAAGPVIQLSAKWRVRDDGEQWVLQKCIDAKARQYWEPCGFWTYRASLLRAIAEAGISANEPESALLRLLPAAHPSRGLPSAFPADAFVRAIDQGRLDLDRSRIIAEAPNSAEAIEATNWYRRYRPAWLAQHSLPPPRNGGKRKP